MEEIKIKKIGLAQMEQLQIVSRQTFLETFTEGNTEENLQLYLEEGFTANKLTSELADPGSEFYFAMSGNKVAGYLKINAGQAQTEIRDRDALEIERIYILKAFQGQKVGQILFDTAINIAKQAGAGYVWLGVWEANLRAINFYKKNGFVQFDKHVFKLGTDEQTDIMMKKTLVDDV